MNVNLLNAKKRTYAFDFYQKSLNDIMDELKSLYIGLLECASYHNEIVCNNENVSYNEAVKQTNEDIKKLYKQYIDTFIDFIIISDDKCDIMKYLSEKSKTSFEALDFLEVPKLEKKKKVKVVNTDTLQELFK